MHTPLPPENGLDTFADEIEEDSDEGSTLAPKNSTDFEYEPEESSKPILFSQEPLNDLIRNLALSKQKAELLASKLQENNLLHADVVVTHYRKCNMDLSTIFRVDGPLCYCHNIKSLYEKLGENYIANEWCLFLQHTIQNKTGNTKPSVPAAHSVYLKESYKSIEILLNAIKYSDYKWKIYGDLKVIGILMGMQGGITKHCCFICLWDSHTIAEHYIRRDWPARGSYISGIANVQSVPLVEPKNVIMPPLHIKLGLMKNFVKALGKSNSNGFTCLCKKFHKIR